MDGATADARADAPPDAASGFGTLGGMCDVLADPELLGDQPALFESALTFQRAFVDPADRPLLTPGGRTLREVPNAGGSSVYSEVFAFEQLARCELAELVKTETQIVYDIDGKKTDILVAIDGHKIGVSVVRAFAYPLGDPYTAAQAAPLIQGKLEDIQASTMNVSAADRWEKQILAVIAWDDEAAGVVADVWATFAPAVRADTIVVVTPTHGADVFIYDE